MSILEQVKLKNVFHYFEEISRIPHGSYHTGEISDYLAGFAKERGLAFWQDSAGNVIIVKEASAGYEKSEPVIIQGHMDMVCEKENGCGIDFEKDGLDLYVDGDFLKARGTTLGADDGIAVAYALAVLEDDSLMHPRIEAVFTVDEEVGLLGAKALDVSMLKGHILLNIDSDIEGHFLTSCAGGRTARVQIPVSRENREGLGVSICLRGLYGGHSGSEIDKERANAIIEMGRILYDIGERMEIGISVLEGGLKDNAIPREAQAIIVIAPEEERLLREHLLEITETLQKEYAASDPGLIVEMEALEEKNYEIISKDSMRKALGYLRCVPNGVMHMSASMEGMVETSLNAGIMKLDENGFCVTSSVRSSVESRKEELVKKISVLAGLFGGSVSMDGDYPAWEYRADSNVRSRIAETYQKMFGEEPVFEAIHAGLECGILSGKIKDLDAVSFGPDNFDIHTPNERLSISSAERVYEFLVELLRGMK